MFGFFSFKKIVQKTGKKTKIGIILKWDDIDKNLPTPEIETLMSSSLIFYRSPS